MFFGDEEVALNKGNNLLIIDWNNLLWRSYHAHASLSFAGHSTSCLYGTVTQLAKYLALFKPKHVVVTDDDPPYFRKELYSNFKAGRSKLDDETYNEFHKSKLDCIEFLKLLDIPLIKEKGLESDDLMASFVQEYHKQFDKIILLSNDDDLYQLLSYPNVLIQKSKILYSIKEFNEEFPGIYVEDFAKLTAMSGSHNGLPGLPGIGRVRASKILTTGGWGAVYSQNKETLDLFMRIIKLPFVEYKTPSLTQSSFNDRKTTQFLARFGIKFTQNMSNAFEVLN